MRNETWISNKFIELSAEQDKCIFEMVKKGSCPKKNECRYPHLDWSNSARHDKHGKVCFYEIVAPGNCERGDACHFRHAITEDERNSVQFRQKVEEERKSKKGMCVNEYIQRNSCMKKNGCTFRHDIREEERQCPDTRERMHQRWCKVTGKNTKPTSNTTEPLQVVEEMKKFMFEVKRWMRTRP